MTEVYDDRRCDLGEGPLWHPERGQLFWFDILGRRLLSRDASGPLDWNMGEHASAAGWVDRDTLLIATETGLERFDIASGARERIAPLEADRADMRSNDGRADPMGGFWIGTMGKDAAPRAGTIYRFHRGRVERLFSDITIPNAICFAPDGRRGYYADTVRQKVWTVALDAEGWPEAGPQVFLDLRDDGLNPDGAVTDAEGALWIAQWGAGRVARYLPDGRFDRAVPVPARQPSCPAFGAEGFDRLYVTTALEGLAASRPEEGQVFVLSPGVTGRAEPRVVL